MSCPEGRRPSRIPRPTPPGSLVDAGRNIGLSPHSPLARGSRIPRISSFSTPRQNLNESFTIPERRTRTLSPRIREPPAGVVDRVVMRTTEPKVNYDEWPERIPRNAASTPRRRVGQNTVPERRAVTMSPRIPNYAGCLPTPQVVCEDSSPTGRPRDERQDGNNRRLDMSGACEEDMGPGDADFNTSTGTYYSANDSDCEGDEFVMADEFEPVSEFERSPGPSPPPRGTSGRRRWVKQPQEELRTTAGCLPTWGLRIADMAESSSTPPPQTRAARPVPGTSVEQTPCLDLQERTGISCSERDSGGAGCSPDEDDEWADWEDPGVYVMGIAPGETADDYERRHQDLIDSFLYPKPSLRPMAGCRVDPRPGESPRSFLRRNYQAEDEYAAQAPPGEYTYGRRPGESWEDRDLRHQQLIDQFWQAVQRNPLPPMSPVDYSYSGQQQQRQAHARLAQQIAMGPTEQDFMDLMSSYDDCSPPQELQQAHARLAQQIAMGPTEQDFMDLMPSDDDDCSPPQELQQPHARLAQQMARQQDFMSSPPDPCPPMPRQRKSPGDSMRRRALTNSQQRRSVNEDFFGIGMDDDCPQPSTSQQASRFPSPRLPTVSEYQGLPPPQSPVRRPSPQRSEPSRGKPRPSGVSSCVPSNVADLIHGYGSI